ncbi:immunoglobulin lambda-1 light chain-like isoform X3 [Alosa pseudoharengus]|uniref:immunoglobulin lambda-1 light chain-like isoform X3 n=1 Tax=Alosa pseudoharengus TaxID=34774 RepID=UPI003F8A9992
MLGTLCTLITALACVSGVTVLTQKPPVLTVRKGETATLHCNLGTVKNSYALWYKQIPGETPQYMLYFYHSSSSPTYASGFSAPKFDSKHSSQSDYSLIINTIEVGDSAVYYCQTWDSSVSEHVFGQGTKLIVTDSALPAASLTLFPPSSAELQADRVSVVCVAEDLPTGFAEVSWAVSGNPVSSGISTGSPQQQPNKKFRLSSLLTIQTADWTSDKDVSCQVASASSTASKSIKQSDCSN